MNNFATRALARVLSRRLPPCRQPDFIVGAPEPYMLRWYLIPRNRWLNIYLHQIRRSDDDRACHDHPWISVSLMLAGPIGEWSKTDRGQRYRQIEPGECVYRSARFAHRLEVLTREPRDVDGDIRVYPLTFFITGPRIREWGFLCPSGWKHWRDFVTPGNSGSIGRGCD